MRKALLLLFLGITIQTLAQETISIKVPNHGYPKVTTYTDEQIKKFESVTTPTIPNIQSFGNLPAGTSPTPSPESAVVNRFKDIAVNSFTGTAIVPLPLYTLQDGALSVPISLNYNASGMKTHEVASWSGMNWALSAGGMISRQVRGIPDEGKLDINTWSSSYNRKGYYWDGFKNNISTVNDDTEPDVFYMNINGQSYKFMYKYSGEPRFIFFPDADIQVTPTFQFISGTVGRFTKFEVLMPDGTKYIFGDGAYEKSTEVDVKFAQSESIHPGASKWNHYWKNEAVTSAWYLRKIISPYGQEINFIYDNVQYSFFKLSEDQATGICPTPAQVQKKINKVYVEGASLSTISSTNKRVEFNKNFRLCYVTELGNEFCYNTTPPRLDLDVWDAEPFSQSNAKQLIEMIVKDNEGNPSDSLIYRFDYGHFSAVENDLPDGYTTADVGTTHQKRLRLEKVTLPDKSFYRFRYNGDSPNYNGKSRLNYGIDHWGFANGFTSNRVLTGLIPKDSFFSTCTPNTSNRETDPSFGFEGSLDSIIVSTGSQTKFIYETHQARNYKNGSIYKPIGGARIKEVRSKDLISGIETVKSYSYVMTDGVQPSGFMAMKPIYRFSNSAGQLGSNSGIYDRLLSEISRPVVGYSRVVEQIKDGTGTPLGKTVYTFNQDTTEISTERLFLVNCTTGEEVTCDTVKYYQPERIREGLVNVYDYSNGNPLKIEVFNQNNDTLSIQSFNYDFAPSTTTVEQTLSAKVFKVNGYDFGYSGFGGGVFLQEYFSLFKKYRIKSQISKVFSQTGTAPISTIQNFTYKDEMSVSYNTTYKGKHNFLVKTETTDGQGHSIESLSKYVADFSFGLDTILIERTCYDPEFGTPYPCDTTEYVIHAPKIGSQARGIYEMQTKHILAAEVETWAKNNGRIVGANYNRFGPVNVGGTGFNYFLKENFALNGIASNTLIDVDYKRADNDTIYRDNRYYSVIDYQNYNPLGLPKQVKPFGGAVSGTDYDASNLLPLRSIQNIGGNVIDTTFYEYEKKIFGLSKQISPNKLAINYAYYTDAEQNKVGQLKQITDKDGNVLAHYEYPYLNQSLQGTAGTFTTDASKNRVVSRSPRIATTNPYQDYTKVSTSVTYADGSGRSLQSVGYKLSPTAKDLLSSTPEYDSYGRPKKNILPVASSVATGQYQSNFQSLAQTFYADTAPYSEVTQYEASPLSRTFKGIGAGAAFRPNKESEQKFETGNFGIAKYELDINGLLQISSYTGNEIFKTTGIDEQGQKSISFADKDGRTLESHVQFTGDGTQTNHYLITTYVYDYLGRMAMVIPPKLYGKIPNNTAIASSPYLVGLYLSKYDERNRVVETHTPNAGWSYMIYNRLGQMVMSQNSRIRANNQWEFVKYDAFGRTATTGVLVNNSSRATLQTAFDNYTQDKQYEEQDNSGVEGYTNRSFPFLVDATEIMTVNYYDDYSWKDTTDLAYVAYKGTRYPNAKGLLTGNKVRRLDTQAWLRSAMYYDDKNRLIQSQSENRFGTVGVPKINQTDMVFDFIGQLLEERTIYRKPSSTDIESRTAYSYDHAGRKTQAIHFYTGHAPELLATYEYDELGRMIRKNLNEAQKDSIIRQNESLNEGVTDVAKKYILLKPGTTIKPDSVYLAFIGSGLQSVSYAYNIKGNLRGINLTSNGRLDSSKVFSLKLDHYEDGRLYNGLLSKQSWKSHSDTTTRQLLYDYDKANRYTNTQFSGKPNEKYNENLSYDSNGNIKKLNRFGLESANNWQRIDSLSYHYDTLSNQLNGVLDFATLKGHKDNGDSTDYTYYSDGSLKSDANKGITNVVYNYLGLQDEIQFGENQKIKNIYTADGIKLAQLLINGSTTIRTDYIGGLIYRNDTLISISHDEGIIKRKSDSSYKYQYFITDHLGNNRVIFEKLNDTVYLAQRADYYAFGGLMEGLSSSLDSTSWRWLYQSQEYVDAFGNNAYDFHARGYDANLGRFDGIDPVDNYMLSGYAGMNNNPISYIDPDGRNPIMIGFMIGMFASSINHMIKGTMPKNMWDFVKPGVIGAIGGGLGSLAPIGVLPGMAYGAGSGAVTGGLSAALNGGNIGRGALYGAIGGAALGGISGGIEANRLGANIWTGTKISTSPFTEPSISSEALPATDEYLDEFAQRNFGEDYHSKFGIKTLSTENVQDKIPKGRGFKLGDDGFIYNGNEKIGGITFTSAFKKSDILISPKVFAYGEDQLFNVTGHEFIHAWHNVLGLTLKYPNNNHSYTESVANQWSANVTASYGQKAQSAFYEQTAAKYLKLGGKIPSAYNVPNWFPNRIK